MKTIYKYTLEIKPKQEIKMRTGYRILSVQMQYNSLVVWAEVPSEDPDFKVYAEKKIFDDDEVHFRIFGSGHQYRGTFLTYVGTVQQGPLVWHVFTKQISRA